MSKFDDHIKSDVAPNATELQTVGSCLAPGWTAVRWVPVTSKYSLINGG